MSLKVIVNTLGVDVEDAHMCVLPSSIFVSSQIINGVPTSFTLETDGFTSAYEQVEVLWLHQIGCKIITSEEEEVAYIKELEYYAQVPRRNPGF